MGKASMVIRRKCGAPLLTLVNILTETEVHWALQAQSKELVRISMRGEGRGFAVQGKSLTAFLAIYDIVA